jgi:hypothetical protein
VEAKRGADNIRPFTVVTEEGHIQLIQKYVNINSILVLPFWYSIFGLLHHKQYIYYPKILNPRILKKGALKIKCQLFGV